MVVLFLFAFTAFATSDKLGSPGAVWEALTEVRWLLRAMKVPLLSLTSVLSSLGWKASSCRRQCWRQLSDYEIPRRGYLLLVCCARSPGHMLRLLTVGQDQPHGELCHSLPG